MASRRSRAARSPGSGRTPTRRGRRTSGPCSPRRGSRRTRRGVRDDIDHPREGDHHKPAVVHHQSVREQVAVREALPARATSAGTSWSHSAADSAAHGSGLGQVRGGGPIRCADELEQQLGVQHLHRVGDRHPAADSRTSAPNSALARWPTMACRPNVLRLAIARPPATAWSGALQAAAVAVEHPVLGGAVLLGGEQAGPACRARRAGAGRRRLPCRSSDAELGIDCGQVGDQPVRMGLQAPLGRDRLVEVDQRAPSGRPSAA